MKNNSVHLQHFVVESLHPKTLVGQRFSSNEFEKWRQYINKEIDYINAQAFNYSLVNRKRRHDYVSGIISQLTELSNIINGYLYNYSKVWYKNAAAIEIRQGYMATCLAFESLLGELAIRYPEIAGQTIFTDYMLRSVKVDLKSLLANLRCHLEKQQLNPDLCTVILDGLTHLVNLRPLPRAREIYVRKLMRAMLDQQFISSEVLTDYMIINDFNLPLFFLFCVNGWSGKLTYVDGLLEQSGILLEIKSHLFDLTLSRGLKFPLAKERLSNELNMFLSEKYSLIKEKLKISRQFVLDEGNRPRAKRILINLSVAQLGLFIRLQVEKGILAKEHIGELFAFFARNFYTPHTDFISADSLQKKSSDVEHATAVKLKAHLIAMLNWLNSHYNLSNYN